MGGHGRQIGGLALVLMGVLGLCLACGLPMWRETSFVGANVVTAQSVWDGLWLHCILQATGQMQCKRHTTSITLTPDIQAGRVLTLLSILAGLLGFIVTLLGGGVANCSGAPPDPLEPPTSSATRKKVLKLFKVCLLGGALCVLSGILCLVSVSWSAGTTISVYNDPLVTAALKREVGSSIYIGWASSVLLLLGGALICFICGEKERPPPSYYSYMPYSTNTQLSSSRMATLRSDDVRSNSSRMFDRPAASRMVEHVAQVHDHNSLNKAQSGVGLYNQETQAGSEQGMFGRNPSNRSGTPDKGRGLFMGMKPNLVRDVPSRATAVQSEYYYNMP
ncbi:claudin-4-like [Enoplosus armatus]|uniref:claudin-4-like n=1 Tax=Enoplosus armatus TaxID=215367 RepID=UPI003994785F